MLTLDLDWRTIFIPDMPLLEIFIRGTVVYLGLFIFLKSILKRQVGRVDTADLLLIVLIADAAQNAMGGSYKSIPDGLLLVLVLIFWNYAIDRIGFYLPKAGRFIHPPPISLIDRGRLIRDNLKRQSITEDELLAELRVQGVESVDKVKTAQLEADGRISVIRTSASESERLP